MIYLIDTDIIIYSLRNNQTVQLNFQKSKAIPKAISVVTYGELVYGARKSQLPQKNLATTRRIAELFPILDITPSVMDTFGELKALLEMKGNKIDEMDLLIASTALCHNLILVTNNTRHYGRIEGLKLENWSEND
jgi:tRNA(fMet)-specific endonuclease VapC